MAAIDASALVSSLGDYFREHRDVLIPQALNGFETSKIVKHFSEVVDELPLVHVDTSAVVQPYQSGWTPRGNEVDISAPNTLKARMAKVDLEIDTYALYHTWKGYLHKNQKRPEDFPFEQHVMEHIMRQIAADHENIAINGSYVAPTPGTPGAVATTAHGLKKLLADAIVAASVTPVVTGAVTSANAVTKVEDVYMGLSDAAKNVGGHIIVSNTLLGYYNQHYRVTYGSSPYNTDPRKRFLDLDPNWELVALPGMATSGRVIFMPTDHFCMGYNMPVDSLPFSFQANRRVIDALTTYTLGFQCARWENVSCNDQA